MASENFCECGRPIDVGTARCAACAHQRAGRAGVGIKVVGTVAMLAAGIFLGPRAAAMVKKHFNI